MNDSNDDQNTEKNANRNDYFLWVDKVLLTPCAFDTVKQPYVNVPDSNHEQAKIDHRSSQPNEYVDSATAHQN